MHLGFVVMNKAAEHSLACFYGDTFWFLGILLGLELLDPLITIFNTLRNCQAVPNWFHHITSLQALYKVAIFSHLSLHLLPFFFLTLAILVDGKVESFYGFDLHYSGEYDIKYILCVFCLCIILVDTLNTYFKKLLVSCLV